MTAALTGKAEAKVEEQKIGWGPILRGKVAVVTGAAAAIAFAQSGARRSL